MSMDEITVFLELPLVCTKLILTKIPHGQFIMGSNEIRGLDDWTDTPMGEFNVTISKDYWLGSYPITQCQWQSVMDSNPSHFRGDNLPVEKVTWHDCMEFCRRLNADQLSKIEVAGNYTFRPPTEAEWEYACKAGLNNAYQLGDTIDKLSEIAWFRENCPTPGPQVVGQKKPNEWGLYDMLGNVFEWCFDCPVDYPIGTSQIDWVGEHDKEFHNMRGGCAYNSPYDESKDKLTCTGRTYASSDPIQFYGFRVCLGTNILVK